MSRAVFKSNKQGQILLFPTGLDEKIPQDSPARPVNQIVDNLDIAQIIETYKGGGMSAYHLRMMLKVVLYIYLNNIYSSRKIEQPLADRISFVWLARGQQPDHNTINRFRSCLYILLKKYPTFQWKSIPIINKNGEYPFIKKNDKHVYKTGNNHQELS